MPDNDAPQRRDALEALLVRRSTEALEPSAESMLEQLLGEFSDVDTDAFDRAAAAVWLAATPAVEPMPARLRRRIMDGLASVTLAAPGDD